MLIRHVVLTQSFAGVERHVCVLANAQARRGHQVQVWGGDPASMLGLLLPHVDYQPAEAILPTIMRSVRLNSPDILHAHMTKAEVASLPARALGDTPLVVTRHFASQRGRRRGGAVVRALMGHMADAQIAISAFVASAVDGPSTVVYPGVEIPEFAATSRSPVVLLAQRLQSEKNSHLAVHAFAAGAPEHWTLEVAGDGPERPRLEALAAELGIVDRVHFLGFRHDIPQIMARASVMIAPCAIEGLGLSVLEAMAHHLPVIASRAGAHPETVGRAQAARLFPADDWREAAAQLSALCGDRDAREEYGNQLADVQRNLFTPESQAIGTEAVYRKVLA